MSIFGDLDIYEIKLGDDFLMSNLFHEAETQLSKLGLAELDSSQLDVVVGGLGLGFTGLAALEDPRVNSLVIVDYLPEIIEWHKSGLIPFGKKLVEDSRCCIHHGDFFAMSRDVSSSFDPANPKKKHDAILLDIDHTPSNVLHQSNARFYTSEGLSELKTHLKPGGVFGLWADGNPDTAFKKHLSSVFSNVDSHTIEFDNPIIGRKSSGAVYVART